MAYTNFSSDPEKVKLNQGDADFECYFNPKDVVAILNQPGVKKIKVSKAIVGDKPCLVMIGVVNPSEDPADNQGVLGVSSPETADLNIAPETHHDGLVALSCPPYTDSDGGRFLVNPKEFLGSSGG